MNVEQELESKFARRMKIEDRYLARLERREEAAAKMIGIGIREGKNFYYIWPRGGKYREGQFYDLVDFLIRNDYV